MHRNRAGRVWLTGTALVLAAALSAAVFVWLHHHDNKYTAPRPAARDGVMRLEGYDGARPVHLVDGWEFYRYKLLTPAQIADQLPDAYLFLGQYGGFELDDPAANPHGAATYRTTLLLDEVPRVWALELPEIHTAYRLWVNGELLAGVGDPDGQGPFSGAVGSMIAFRAGGAAEIVVAVSDERGFYSGMVYPPAFGGVQAVNRLLSLRLLAHGAACGVALLIGVFCLLLGARRGRLSANALLLALLCVCFLGLAGYPVAQSIGIQGAGWHVVERVCGQGLALGLLVLTGRLCAAPRTVRRTVGALGLAACLLALFPGALFDGTAASLYRVSGLLGGWRWLSALCLLAYAAWGLRRGRESVRGTPLLAGALVYAAALVVDRALPLFEPMVGGWHAETAGFVFLLLIAGVLWRDTAAVYRESLLLEERAGFAEQRLELQLEQSRLERAHAEQTHKLRHELRSNLAVLQVYLRGGEIDRARAQIDALLEESAGPSPVSHCPNELVNAILATHLAKAEALGARLRCEARVPERLPLPDREVGSVLVNLLTNALEALALVEPPGERWLDLRIDAAHGYLSVECANAHAGRLRERGGRLLTTKAGQEGHGLGLGIVRDIAKRRGGQVRIEHDPSRFCIHVALPLPNRQE